MNLFDARICELDETDWHPGTLVVSEIVAIAEVRQRLTKVWLRGCERPVLVEAQASALRNAVQMARGS